VLTRNAALALLAAVFERRRPIEEALDALPSTLEARDRGAAHRIAAAVLRRAGSLDAVLEPFLRREPPPVVRAALRMGAAELLLLGTPAHAAVAATVEVVPRPFAGLVNAVLRKVAAEGSLEGLDAERLDTPPWLWSAWHAAYGPAVRAIARAHQVPAPLDISLKPGVTPPEGAVELPTGSWRLPAGTRAADLPGLAEGQFWVQDAAAALPAKLLAVKPGERVADLCAAPGGKTAHLLERADADLLALDVDPQRCQRITDNLQRLGLQAEVRCADAAQPATWWDGRPFDAILLDAPCTASGIVRRHPDVRWLRRDSDVAALARTQRALLDALWPLLREGGRLVYATCSVFRAEGSEQLQAFLQRHTDALSAPAPGHLLPGLPDTVGEFNDNRSRGPDGFYYACIDKARAR